MAKTNIEFHLELLNNLPPVYKKWLDEEEKFVLENISRDSKVLDVGCGDGRAIGYLLNLTQNIIAIDQDPIAIDLTNKKYSMFPGVKARVMKAQNLDFEDEFFDEIVCVGLFPNLGEYKLKTLNEMVRVLKPGGSVILSSYSENALSTRLELYKKINWPIKEIKKDGTAIFEDSVGTKVTEQFSEIQLREFFMKANLKVEKIVKLDIAYIFKLRK